ncbi:META domain-containing protein [Streptomyces sp. NBC_00285]|uniref:META domain-containing protein n=1 Tax=Streptomyces sp. NBC_00285 TaxID=2975700 RepID=UPI002E2C184C|nr:META domain-containing protein [Streptomyces sp. NBC_00285]
MKRTTYVKYAAAALAGTAVLAACGTESGSGSGPVGEGETKKAPAIADAHWIPRKVTVDGKDYPLPEGKGSSRDEAEITFKPGTADPDVEGGESGGSVGCNSFGADAEIVGDTVRISDLAMTAMGCPGPVGEFEQKFIRVFDNDLKAAVQERNGIRTLTLTSPGGDSITLHDKSADPPPLKGTRWAVETQSDTKTDTKAYLTLTKDDAVTGSLGCNTFHGKATVKGGTIEFGRLATTRMVCSGPVMKTERELAEILSGKVSYLQERDSLTLTTASGKDLRARAE